MKKFLVSLLVILLVLTLLVGCAAVGFGAYVYYNFFQPVEADFTFVNPVSEIKSVEIINVLVKNDEEFELVPLCRVEDVDAFLADFENLKCNKGFSVEDIAKMETLDRFDAFKVTFNDDSYEVVTAYGNLDSSLFTPDATFNMFFEKDYYSFDTEEFLSLLEKYSTKE